MRRSRSSFDLRDALTAVEALTPAPSAAEVTPTLLESEGAPWIAFGRELSGQASVSTHTVALDETPMVGQSPAWLTLVEVRKDGRGLVVGVSQEGPPSDELRGMLTSHAHALSEASLPQIGLRLVEVLLGKPTEASPLEEASEVAASLDAPAAARSWSDRVDADAPEPAPISEAEAHSLEQDDDEPPPSTSRQPEVTSPVDEITSSGGPELAALDAGIGGSDIARRFSKVLALLGRVEPDRELLLHRIALRSHVALALLENPALLRQEHLSAIEQATLAILELSPGELEPLL